MVVSTNHTTFHSTWAIEHDGANLWTASLDLVRTEHVLISPQIKVPDVDLVWAHNTTDKKVQAHWSILQHADDSTRFLSKGKWAHPRNSGSSNS
jgi:hypothetical protein